jgi:hypothetical protein
MADETASATAKTAPAPEAQALPPGPSAVDVAADEYRNAAAGLRSTARWIASAFAAIPGLAVVGSLIKGPGSGGWEWLLLAPGIIAATVGAILGIYKFADVQRPGELTDSTVTDGQMTRLPEAHDFATFEALRGALERTRAAVSRAVLISLDAKGRAEAAAAEVASAEALLKALVASVSDKLASDRLAGQAEKARSRLVDLSRHAADAAAESAVATRAAEAAAVPFTGYESLRRAAFGLALADVIKSRFNKALQYGALAAALVALGITLVALAPKEKEEKAKPAAAPTLVYLKLSAVGRTKLGCSKPTAASAVVVPAISVGGSEEKPHVITLPTADCPKSTELDFPSGTSYGTVAPAVKPKKKTKKSD